MWKKYTYKEYNQEDTKKLVRSPPSHPLVTAHGQSTLMVATHGRTYSSPLLPLEDILLHNPVIPDHTEHIILRVLGTAGAANKFPHKSY
jgi:hypothetical protein